MIACLQRCKSYTALHRSMGCAGCRMCQERNTQIGGFLRIKVRRFHRMHGICAYPRAEACRRVVHIGPGVQPLRSNLDVYR
jgi:hypothetical protein